MTFQTVKDEYEAIVAAMNSNRNEEHKDEEEEVSNSCVDGYFRLEHSFYTSNLLFRLPTDDCESNAALDSELDPLHVLKKGVGRE